MKTSYDKWINRIFLASACFLSFACSDDNNPAAEEENQEVSETVYDETGCLYTSYTGLVMAGYQGWFAAEGDGSNRGWYHYQQGNTFEPGTSTIDFWPDVSEYTKTYKSPFQFTDGSDAYLYSPYDEESVDLHFQWMQEYGLDGVHMQRFIAEVKPSNEAGKRHFNQVLSNALKAAKKYERAISVMYDLSGSNSEDVAYLEEDWNELQETFDLFNNVKHPTYLRHNGKPLVAIWGVGFNDGREYSISEVNDLVDRLKGPENKVSIMLGVPYYWRELRNDTENNPELHELIRKVDIIMPWAVGRYNNDNYNEVAGTMVADVIWCRQNNIDYVPLVFPGFSWGNMNNDPSLYNSIPRLEGDFLWKQVAGARQAGVESLYVAMFDEVDEGTAIFKCLRENEVPLNGDLQFMGIEQNLPSDHYLWLTGQASNWFHGDSGYGSVKPNR
ncbi:glycoside hydrolase family 71/99-like protein [Sinomicrobium sp. M5D2P17]